MSREEIREGIKKRLCQLCWLISREEDVPTMYDRWEECYDGKGCMRCEDTADEILQDEDSQGVAIKVDRELPELEAIGVTFRRMDYDGSYSSYGKMTQKDMLKAGYVAVAPLRVPQ